MKRNLTFDYRAHRKMRHLVTEVLFGGSSSEVRTTDLSSPQRQVCHPLRDTSDVCSFHNRSRMPPNPEPIVMISGEGDEWQPADMIGVALFRAVRSFPSFNRN